MGLWVNQKRKNPCNERLVFSGWKVETEREGLKTDMGPYICSNNERATVKLPQDCKRIWREREREDGICGERNRGSGPPA